ncbi:lipopolysaccharide biosynthesis protein [Selenomonas caprae]|uniref:Lipopolysaccharide biosynthesis protein n=1 Tax=Selenomonas caprae TaxID=2606905 RepID=A0A5D6WLY7_9FIRM|nr:lipopolysaccharide biosynthesis protein [Selenomonas caprae]TYZ29116.1 lipopolysaccharide biosynthesis protein [Selenomonas caprae]
MKEKIYANILKVFMGSAGAQGLWVLSMLIVSRLYTVEDLGIQQLFISGASLLASIATGRYELAITLPRYRFQAANLLIFAGALSVFGSLLIFIGIIVFNEEMIAASGLKKLDVIFMPLYAIEICWYMLSYAWLVREEKYAIASKGLILFPTGYLIMCIGLSGIKMPLSSLVLSILLARGFEILYYAHHIINDLHQYSGKLSLTGIVKLGNEYIDFPKYLMLGGFVDTAKNQVIPFLVAAFWGTIATGYYSLATQCLAAPAGLIAKSVGDVFRQEASSLYRKYHECEMLYRKTLRCCALYSCIICGLLFVLSPVIIPILFGNQWEEAGRYIQVLLPMTALGLISSPLSNVYIIARQQKKYIYIQFLGFVSSAIGIGVSGYSGFDIEIALIAWGILSIGVGSISIYGGIVVSRGRCY